MPRRSRSFNVRSGILVHADAAETAHNILTSERLFRIGVAIDLIGGACNAVLAVAFYTMLKRVSSSLALLAGFRRLGEAVILGHMSLNGMMVLTILNLERSRRHFCQDDYTHWRAYTSTPRENEFNIGLVYYSLGSAFSAILLHKSQRRPKILGVVGSGLLVRRAHKHPGDHRVPRRRRYRPPVLCPGRHFRNRHRLLADDRRDTYPANCSG